jgi:hypothetical protein
MNSVSLFYDLASQPFWSSFAGAILASGCVGAVVTYLLKRRFAAFDAALQENLSRFGTLHKTRVPVAADLFTRAIRIERLVERWFITRIWVAVGTDEQRSEYEVRGDKVHQELMDAKLAFDDYVGENRLYFSDPVLAPLKDFSKTVSRATMAISQIVPTDSAAPRGYEPVWAAQKDLRTILGEVETRLKSLLGVEAE